jgi:hypothetical protein
MIPQDDHTIVPENRFSTFFKKCLCCRTHDQGERNKKAVYIYQQYLIQEYGDLGAKLALLLSHVDLPNKDSRRPLFVRDARAILDKANEIRGRLDLLKRMVKHIVFFQEIENQKKKKDEKKKEPSENLFLSSPPSQREASSSRDQNIKAVNVQKRYGKVESFQDKKIKRDLKSLPLEKPLSKEVINEIVIEVKDHLIKRRAFHISNDTLRYQIAKQLNRREVVLQPPSFLNLIQERELVEKIEKRKCIDDFTAEECESLIAIMQFVPTFKDS